MNTRVFKSDWFAGTVFTLLFLAFSGSDFVSSIELYAYDLGIKFSTRIPSDKIAIIAIDDKSIDTIGRFPWSRDIHAMMYDTLVANGAKVIGQTAFFPEPQIDSGLKYIRELKSSFDKSGLNKMSGTVDQLTTSIKSAQRAVKNKNWTTKKKFKEILETTDSLKAIPTQLNNYRSQLDLAEKSLDTDARLAQSIHNAGNIVFNMPAVGGQSFGRPDTKLPIFLSRFQIADKNIIDPATTFSADSKPLPVIEMIYPIEQLGTQASSIGITLPTFDIDGVIRTEALAVNYYEMYYPSLALMIAAKSLNLNIDDLQLIIGSGIQLGRHTIHTDSNTVIRPFYYQHKSNSYTGNYAFSIDSFSDVLQGNISAEKYRDKIVLIGATALGIGDTFATPIDPAMSAVVSLAHSVSSILNGDFIIEPEWGLYARLAAIALIAAYIIFLLPKLGAIAGIFLTSLLLSALLMSQFYLMTGLGLWIQLMLPALLLLTGHGLLTSKHFILTEKGMLKLGFESAENNRMLGLSLQGQGQLDMAFERFRKLPLDKSVLELLYNLALDYERKRQFNKARSVYEYISDFDKNFRDVKKRASRAKSLEDNILISTTSGLPADGLLTDDDVGRPRLGRYEVEAELGKGAMGSVYLGKDPKISRTVAIKTLALSREFEDDELARVKERFFREAETAGRLTHPNIVTIFDADEEYDLAFIAMEYLRGDDLRKHIKVNNLLPIEQVLSIIKRAADAIDYAHRNHVVHRDIKPANIMWDANSDTLKITDFGIARITDTSKTKTGVILGTPSYMSPEQLSGNKVTGQSDIFSLGIMLFQMVTGKLPFSGDSMTALMFKIANQSHPKPESINPNVPRCVSIVINRAMEKDINKRYKHARDMVNDIEKCLKIIAAENKPVVRKAQ